MRKHTDEEIKHAQARIDASGMLPCDYSDLVIVSGNENISDAITLLGSFKLPENANLMTGEELRESIRQLNGGRLPRIEKLSSDNK